MYKVIKTTDGFQVCLEGNELKGEEVFSGSLAECNYFYRIAETNKTLTLDEIAVIAKQSLTTDLLNKLWT